MEVQTLKCLQWQYLKDIQLTQPDKRRFINNAQMMPINRGKNLIFVTKDFGSFLSHRVDLFKFLIASGYTVSLVTDFGSVGPTAAGGFQFSSIHHIPFASAKDRPWQMLKPTFYFYRWLFANRQATVFAVTLPADHRLPIERKAEA